MPALIDDSISSDASAAARAVVEHWQWVSAMVRPSSRVSYAAQLLMAHAAILAVLGLVSGAGGGAGAGDKDGAGAGDKDGARDYVEALYDGPLAPLLCGEIE